MAEADGGIVAQQMGNRPPVATGMQRTVLRDCALRHVVAYTLPEPLSVAVLQELSVRVGHPLHVDAFSQFVQGASDHFKLQVSDYSFAQGPLEQERLVVTYGKLGQSAPPSDVDWLERFLQARYGAFVP